ncbi:glutamate decarboxylase gad1 [Coemansia sp. RSA 2671]|nr:glutamate decarboxylase gad1 [Coemansia sp. RSA 2671]
MSKALDRLHKEHGWEIPIHVDGACGAMIAPFVFPDLAWDFRVPHVASISTSGHKFGLTYPGIGWVVWRSPECLPSELTFELSYLGGVEKTFTLNFSHPACFLIAQYYQFIRFGRSGFTRMVNACMYHARLLSVALEATGAFECMSDMHRPRGQFGFSEATRLAASNLFAESAMCQKSGADPSVNDVYNYGQPEVAFRFSDWFIQKNPNANQDVVSTLLRVRGWIIPNYPLPPNRGSIRILRVVIRETSSEDTVNRLVRDIMWATQTMLESLTKPLGEALLRPLPPTVSTSDLARDVAATHKVTMNDSRRSSHWEGLLGKIGELKAAASSAAAVIDKEAKKAVYQHSC